MEIKNVSIFQVFYFLLSSILNGSGFDNEQIIYNSYSILPLLGTLPWPSKYIPKYIYISLIGNLNESIIILTVITIQVQVYFNIQ